MMNIGIPAAAILAVIIIAYFATKKLGIAIRFHLLLICGIIGLFLGLMLPRILLPQLSLAITLLILMLFMILLSIILAWFFAKDNLDEEKTAFATNLSKDANRTSSFKEKIEQITINSSEKLGLEKLQKILFEEVVVKEENASDIEEKLNIEEVIFTSETTIDDVFSNEEEDFSHDIQKEDEIPVLIADEVALDKFENKSTEPVEIIYLETEPEEDSKNVYNEKTLENDVNVEEDNPNVVYDENEMIQGSDSLEEYNELEEEWTGAEFDLASINAETLDVVEYSANIKIPSEEAVNSSNMLSEYEIKQSAYTDSFAEVTVDDTDDSISVDDEDSSYGSFLDDISYTADGQTGYQTESIDDSSDLVEENPYESYFETQPSTIDNTSVSLNNDMYAFTNDDSSIIAEENHDADTDDKLVFAVAENVYDNEEQTMPTIDDSISVLSANTIRVAENIQQEASDTVFDDRDINIEEQYSYSFDVDEDALPKHDNGLSYNVSDDDSTLSKDKIFMPIDKNYIDAPVFSVSEYDLPEIENTSDVNIEGSTSFSADDKTAVSEEPVQYGDINTEQYIHMPAEDDSIDNEYPDDEDLPYSRLTASLEKIMPAVNDAPTLASSDDKQMSVPKSDSIDDILDFAFEQRESGNDDAAIMALNIAYDMYMHLETSVPIIVEIANIYKSQGNYKDAIAALQRGFDNVSNEVIRQDFILNIAYLRIIRNILSTNNLGLLPYNEIPVKVKEEIEKEFSEWKKGFK